LLVDEPAYSASDPPEFEIAAWRGKLTITGHTQSAKHEERLKRAVSEHFPGQVAQFTFRPLGVAPDWWETATAELITAIARVESPGGKLRGSSVRIRGVVASKSTVTPALEALQQALPDATDFDVRLAQFQPNVTARTLCERQFAALKPGPVKFEESGTELRASAFPELDRIVALADACRDSTVSITGHTDSSGNEEWNRQLSLARAEMVANYLGTRGVNQERLVVVGAGSSLPVADNSTRYGRSLNRRIEIRLASKN
jgi:outer membrane protein OmpA-like peptidoglycan-associated protein